MQCFFALVWARAVPEHPMALAFENILIFCTHTQHRPSTSLHNTCLFICFHLHAGTFAGWNCSRTSSGARLALHLPISFLLLPTAFNYSSSLFYTLEAMSAHPGHTHRYHYLCSLLLISAGEGCCGRGLNLTFLDHASDSSVPFSSSFVPCSVLFSSFTPTPSTSL